MSVWGLCPVMLYYGFYFFDPTYILVIIGSILVMAASGYMRSTYRKYSQIGSRRGVTGEEVARMILRNEGLYNVRIGHIKGSLTDHYHPGKKLLNLSEGSRFGSSIADIGVAAHECGHAIQDERMYWPLKLRGFLVPITNVGAMLSWPIIILGMLLGMNRTLINIGVILFLVVFFFQLVTLPVEFNASRRAVAALEQYDVLDPDELEGTKKVLRAAALTYVAAAASTFLQVARLFLLFGDRRDD